MSTSSERAPRRLAVEHAQADEARLLLAAHDLQLEPGLLAHAPDDLVAVLRLAQRAGGHRAHLRLVAAAQRRVAAQGGEQPVRRLLAASRRWRRRPRPGGWGRAPGAGSRASRPASGRASSRRTALVPTSMAASTGCRGCVIRPVELWAQSDVGTAASESSHKRPGTSRRRHVLRGFLHGLKLPSTTSTCAGAPARTSPRPVESQRPAALHQPRAVLARVQRARPRRGARTRAAALRAAEVPRHRLLEPGRVLHGPGRRA